MGDCGGEVKVFDFNDIYKKVKTLILACLYSNEDVRREYFEDQEDSFRGFKW